MAGLLDALLKNESGGRNVANVHQGTSSGQAQGYFQITTGTWNDFGGQQYAPTPMQASYEQQAAVAAKIPLKRWDESTVAKMRATGIPIDPNRTLGENLAAAGEGFGGAVTSTAAADGGGGSQPPPPPPPDLFARAAEAPRSHLAETLSSSIGRRSGGGQQPALDSGSPPLSPPIEFAKATPEFTQPAAPVAAPAQEDGGLASLFKVKDIGGAGKIDPVTGQPLIPRPKWA